MKYHGFDSPLDWSQYLIQKADKHEYEPSEPGKRVEALLEKLYLPQNSYSYAKFPQWFADAADKGDRRGTGTVCDESSLPESVPLLRKSDSEGLPSGT